MFVDMVPIPISTCLVIIYIIDVYSFTHLHTTILYLIVSSGSLGCGG